MMNTHNGRVLVWFSAGAASACAAKLTLEKYPDAEIVYCDTLKYEHPDNRRFIADVEKWLSKKITMIRSDKYEDIFDVFDKTGWLIGHGMARCTIELKRAVREQYQQPGDLHVFGMGIDEIDRVNRFKQNNPEIKTWWPLVERKFYKQTCLDTLMMAGIELPAMYKLGYRNNNCIGCVKGGMGYWNKIRVDFPEAFERMAQQERKMGATVIKGIYLDELDPTVGRYESEYEVECGPICAWALRG